MTDANHPRPPRKPMLSMVGQPIGPATDLPLPDFTGYEVIRLLGAGGMGIVYEAWQQKPRRRVALKLLRPGLMTPDLLRRFSQEIEILGRLDHPSIAHIYETGTLESGGIAQPFFSMEFVEGRPLADYARERNLPVPDRIDLLVRIGDGVLHAHQRAVIHRDLKPANILVTPEGQPKILDFGVARLADADARMTVLPKEAGMMVGTLCYMPPEQATGKAGVHDVRADVYALGVIGFELLCGELPYDLEDLSVAEAVRCLHDTEPRRLSSLRRDCGGDLDIIIHKAMAKDIEQRYASVSCLTEDLCRYLQQRPIRARPPSLGYQARKFAVRHKLGVLAGVLILAALTGGLLLASIGLVRARVAEAQAVREREVAQANLRKALDTVNQFTTHVARGPLAGIPEVAPIRDQLLKDAVFFYETLLSENPGDSRLKEELDWALGDLARVHRTEGAWDRATGRLDERIAQLEALREAEPDNPGHRRRLARALQEKGQTYSRAGQITPALVTMEQAKQILESLIQDEPENREYRRGLAIHLDQYGQLLDRLGRTDAANQAFSASHALYRDLMREGMADKAMQVELAYVLGHWAQAMDGVDAKQRLAEARALWERLAREYPDDSSIQAGLDWVRRQQAQTGRLRIAATELDQLQNYIGQQAVVHGRVHAVLPNVGRNQLTFIAFGEQRGDFEAVVHRNVLSSFAALHGTDLQQLAGRQVELSGILSAFGGKPRMVLNRPDQIRVVKERHVPSTARGEDSWPVFSTHDVGQLQAHLGQTVSVEGRILSVTNRPRSSITFLNFDGVPGQRFTGVLRNLHMPKFTAALGAHPAAVLPGRTVRVSGKLYLHQNNFNIEIREPDQLNLLPAP